MDDLPVAPWLALIPAYVAISRLRGSSWRAVLLTPTMMLLGALVLFAVPPMWRIDGARRVVVVVVAASIAVLAVWLVRQTSGSGQRERDTHAKTAWLR